MHKDLLIIGSNGFVSAIRPSTGEEVWRTQLREGFLSSSRGYDVSVLIDGEHVFAGCYGSIYALRASDGELLWSNDLKGMGYNEVSIAKQGTSTQFITRVENTGSSGSTT